jgi:hypothetical protein
MPDIQEQTVKFKELAHQKYTFFSFNWFFLVEGFSHLKEKII